ncbi:MAG: N-formylglutamate amidohydrolase [Sandaracinaceae bacterium]
MRSVGVLVTCEHASPALPDGVDLGLNDDVMASHVSYDRGALAIAERLSARLRAPLHRGRFSRLYVDLNRRETNPDVIMATTYGIRVYGNDALDEAAREDRIARVHRPYRNAARADAMRLAGEGHCLHLSIHSFDPTLDPARAEIDAGILYDPDREPERTIATILVDALRARGHRTRHNEPYAGTPEGLTSWLRDQIEPPRYTGIEVEAQQGWVTRPSAVDRFVADLASAVASLASVATP